MENNKKDTRWIAAIMIGLIGVVTFWSIIIPVICVLVIADMYE